MEKQSKKSAYQKPDIGTVEELSAQLLISNQRLEEVNRQLVYSEAQRSEMLANISHDLRAPAAALRSAVDYLLAEKEQCSEEILQIVSIMDRRTAALEHLITELHFLVSIELPGFTLEKAAIDVVPFLQEYIVIQKMNQKFSQRNLRLKADTETEIPLLLDTNRMVRVLDNLFDNALRFTKAGDTITLGCTAGKTHVDIFVRDTGTGIEKDDLDAVFERTRTLDPSRTPGQEQGSGLGLAIVKSIVEKHGGKVWCESETGQGSTFILRFPSFQRPADNA